jgi:outer membrane protein assembly factor BamE (lipoprotein component of BamABCDE complex)
MERSLLVNKALLVAALLVAAICSGCRTTPSDHIGQIQLGMDQDQVKKIMGPPFTVRASKLYENNETSQVWEYIAPVWSLAIFSDKYDKTFWVVFENGKVVQWGEPGDFSGTDTISGTVPVKDYYNKKTTR